MLLRDLVDTSAALRATRSRLTKYELLAACLRRMTPDEIPIGVAYLAGALPNGRIGVGYAVMREVSAAVPPAAAPALELLHVDRALRELAAVAGAGSGAERKRQLGALLAAATADEQQFLAALVLGELRQGASEGVMVEAIARAAEVPVDDVRRALMLSGELGAVAAAALTAGRAGLAAFHLQLFRPVMPMLAQPADDLDTALAGMGDAAAELKLDGARVQLHKSGDEVRVYSRLLNDVTAAVPELVERARAMPARDLVLDGEAIALRPDGSPHPFQTTMRRFGRRLDVAALRGELPLSSMYFDILHVDGDDLIDRPARERAEALDAAVPAAERVPRIVAATPDEVDAFWHDALQRGHEGIMLKALDATYEAGRRGASWRKLKPAHTLDLVVLAAEWGSGRRRGWLSNLHLGARDPDAGAFVMLGKTFKGMTDAILTWQTRELLARELSRDDYTVYVRPELVVEVAFNDVQASPHYPGGMALRFARIKRYRDDKTAADADTIATVRALFEQSHRRQA